MKNLFTVLSVALALFVAAPSYADHNPSMNDWVPSVHSWDIGHVLGTRIAPHMDWNAGMWFMFRHEPLNVFDTGGTGEAVIVKNQFVGNAYAALPLWDIASVGVDVPLYFHSGSDVPAGFGGGVSGAESTVALGDIRLSGKVKFWKNKNKGIGVGLGQDVTVPTHTSDNFVGESMLTSRTTLVVDWNYYGWAVMVNAGYLLRENNTVVTPHAQDELVFSAAAQIPIICDTVEALGAFNSRTHASSPFGDGDVRGGTAFAGVRVRPWKKLVLTPMFGGSFGGLPGTAAWEAGLNVGWEPIPNSCDPDGDGLSGRADRCPHVFGVKDAAGCPDSDGDGIFDDKDKCPRVKGGNSTDGCPDADEDGIADKDDSCPNDKGKEELNGCPDSDGDGIADKDDNCPTVPGLDSIMGCPDSDSDGITDAADKCPDKPGPEATKGCPDKDEDGFLDSVDKCPEEWGRKEYEGCPPPTPKKIIVKKEKIVIMDKVYFDTARDLIKSKSKGILDDIVTVMKENPWLRKVRVDGHTDARGKREDNMVLSKDRAEAVKKYLVDNGVEVSRVETKGFGSDVPLAAEENAAAWKKNRRVEFTILEQGD
jgi:outer membrane protein OmpA-like peptidoglycan-associated protein